MFKKIILSVIAGVCISTANASPKTIKVFTTLAKANEIVDIQKANLPNTKIDVYFIDRKKDIMESLNSNIPTEKFAKWDEEERYEWSQNYLKEIAPKKTLKIMKSTLGVSYMQLFNIHSVPAVLMDDYYLTYGLSITQSIKEYDRK